MRTIKEVLDYVNEKIEKKGLEKSSGLLLIEHLNGFQDRTEIYLHLDEEMKNEDLLEVYLLEYLSGKPIQYILKEAWFLGNRFYVDDRVLIPRMETEELLVAALEIAKQMDKPLVYDIGTGSGCLALSLAQRIENARIVASDISLEALEVAKINCEKMALSNVEFLASDLFLAFPLDQKADMIVCNPPYIGKDDYIERVVKNYEPKVALIPPSGNGLEIYQRLFIALPHHLKKNGFLLAEFGYNQKKALEEMVKRLLPGCEVTFYQDINKNDRYFILKYCE